GAVRRPVRPWGCGRRRPGVIHGPARRRGRRGRCWCTAGNGLRLMCPCLKNRPMSENDDPNLDLQTPVELRLVLAAKNALGALRGLLDDPAHGEAIATALAGLGAPGRNDELPDGAGMPAAPHVQDAQPARDYLTG